MLSITGTVFNVKKKVVCFYLWAFGEIFWMILDFTNHQYGRVFLDSVHFIMALWGIYDWQLRTKIKMEAISKMNNLNLNEQAQEILRIAQKYGVESNFFFITTFERYMQLMKYMFELKSMIEKEGTTVKKSYSKGISNTYVHPALSAYTKTSAEANKTLQTLMKVIREMRNRGSNDEPDPLLEFISGRRKTID